MSPAPAAFSRRGMTSLIRRAHRESTRAEPARPQMKITNLCRFAIVLGGVTLPAHTAPLRSGEIEIGGCIFSSPGQPTMGDWLATANALAREVSTAALTRLLGAETMAAISAGQPSAAQLWAMWEHLEPGEQPRRLDPAGSKTLAEREERAWQSGRRAPRIIA